MPEKHISGRFLDVVTMPGLVCLFFFVASTALLPSSAMRLETSPGAAKTSVEGGLLGTACDWGQRWALAMFAPLDPYPTDEGDHERLGCNANTLAQVMYYHRRCPTGSVEYTVPGFEATSMDFDAEAAENGLCDWPRFTARSRNVTTDVGTTAVARYIYAAALVVRRSWGSPRGTPHYLLSHEKQDVAVSEHYGMEITRLHIKHATMAREEAENVLAQEINEHRPVIAYLIHDGHFGHLVVLDGFRRAASGTEVHVNAGDDGFNNGWYSFHGPMCFTHYKNGTLPADGGCAHHFSHVSYLKLIRPMTPV